MAITMCDAVVGVEHTLARCPKTWQTCLSDTASYRVQVGKRLVLVVACDDAELIEIGSISSGFGLANDSDTSAAALYEVVLASPGGRPIRCRSGLVLPSQRQLERIRETPDTLVVVGGGPGIENAAGNPVVVAHVRRLARAARRVASVCTGAAILAAAGLLDGKRATTHWIYAERLAHRHPETIVDPAPLYIRDGDVTTAAGITSAIDLTLAFIEEDRGADVARQVARMLVTYLQRPGDQAQMSMFVANEPSAGAVVRRVAGHVAARLGDDLSATSLAAVAGVSERHLNRLFRAEVGMTPGRYVRRARLEAAATMLTSSTRPAATIARSCGFRSPETFRQAFVATYGVSPAQYRDTLSASRPLVEAASSM
jgi:transcriptional regulator GlxA family with amidase domain